MKDVRPPLPTPNLVEVVGAHQPDEAGPREASLEGGNRVRRVARAEPRLDVGRLDARIAGGDDGGGEARLEGGHAACRLQRVLRRDEPPDLVEIETPQRFEAEMEVAAMRRVERPADQADPPPSAAGEARRQRNKA